MLHVIRHAEGFALSQRCGAWDAKWAIGKERCWDDGLTPLGKEQAQEAAQQLLAQFDSEVDKPRRLVCSPFLRCVETAVEVGRVLGLPVEVHAALTENLRSEWFGQITLSVEQLRAKGFDVQESGAPQLFPVDIVPKEWEDEQHDRLVRPQRLAAAVRRTPELFVGCVFITHGGVGHQFVRALVSGNDGTADVGPEGYSARATVDLAQLLKQRGTNNGSSNSSSSSSDTLCTLRSRFQSPLRFTPGQDWMSAHEPVWDRLLAPAELHATHFPLHSDTKPKVRVLELGSWEGLSGKKWLQHFQPASLTLVDHFDAANESAAVRAQGQARYDKLRWNLHLTGHFDAVEILPLFTLPALSALLLSRRMFDFIYVDADHTTTGVLSDLVQAWPMLSQHGLMLIDDYLWPPARNEEEAMRGNPPSMDSPLHPKRGIDAFMATHKEQFEIVHTGYQILLRKTTPQTFNFPEEGATHPLRLSSGSETAVAEATSATKPFKATHCAAAGSTPATGAAAASGGAKPSSKAQQDVDAAQTSSALQTQQVSITASNKTVAVLLPLTSRGSTREQLLSSLHAFSACLPPAPCVVLLVGSDDDDALVNELLIAEAFPELSKLGRVFHRVFPSARPAPTPLCRIVADMGQQAFELQGALRCDYFVLLGDDVRITPQRTWLAEVEAAFGRIHQRVSERFAGVAAETGDVSAGSSSSCSWVPDGFGVVALRDCTFPGFPTFPVLGRAHLQLFSGRMWPALFVNQDADPFVWALYRGFGAREFAAGGVELRNLTGGDELNLPRYQRQHVDWKNEVLKDAVKHIQRKLAALAVASAAGGTGNGDPVNAGGEAAALARIRSRCLVTLDVITPSFRCERAMLRSILSLSAPADADVSWVLIVDDPACTSLRTELERDFASWHSLTVRVNRANLGASASRNAGLDEASGEWALFLDDDVRPHPWLLHRYVDAIRTSGTRAAGFAGMSHLPPPCTYLTAGLSLAYLTYFWGVAKLEYGGEQAPWAVTANVLSRRGRTRFDLDFLKTGGGEDILFLRQTVVEQRGRPLLKAPRASIEHPWWDRDQPQPLRFYRWAASDSLLMDDGKLPQHAFYSAPHAVECSVLLLLLGLPWALLLSSDALSAFAQLLVLLSCLWLSEFSLGLHQHLSDTSVAPGLGGWRRVLCSLIGTTYIAWCEAGHTWAPLRRGRWALLCKRVDWWYGLHTGYQRGKQAREARNAAVFAVVLAVGFCLNGVWAAVPVLLMLALLGGLYVMFTSGSRANPIVADKELQWNPSAVSLQDERATMHVSFISDSSYAPALAVALRSLLDHHPTVPATCAPRLLHVHVVDVGLTDVDWVGIEALLVDGAVSSPSTVTFSRIRAPTDHARLRHFPAAMRQHWPLYAKLFLDELLPGEVEACIHLDCDILLRASLEPVWQQLQHSARGAHPVPVLAARDAGLPCGSAALEQFGWSCSGDKADSYFNAGVLGINLRLWRGGDGRAESGSLQLGACLRDLARDLCELPTLQHREQDVLNLVMRHRVQELPHTFNVQGLGTYGGDRAYASATSAENGAARPQLYSVDEWKALSRNPRVVHFTGASSPTPSSVLCPWARAPSKPWAWRCLHPFASEWHATLQRTRFKEHFQRGNHALQQLRQGFEQDLRALGQMVPHATLHAAVSQAASALQSADCPPRYSSGAAGPSSPHGKRCLVAGGAGFIGSHLAKRLKEQGHYVVVADLHENEFRSFSSFCDEFHVADLRVLSACVRVCRGCEWVFNLAADMGGMGFIASSAATLLFNNTLISCNMLEAARRQGAHRFFFASSACVYPESMQEQADLSALGKESEAAAVRSDGGNSATPSVGLHESLAWCGRPQDVYGMEKLLGEESALAYARDFPSLQVRVARFHNIFGPHGTWRGGREKVPAALCRKVAALQLLQEHGSILSDSEAAVELWGDGAQTRSFCFVSDAVEGVLRLMQSDEFAARAPLNIGSDRLVSMHQLLQLVQQAAGTSFPVRSIEGAQGVRGRNSDNTRVRAALGGWQPLVQLEDGIQQTFRWVRQQVEQAQAKGDDIRSLLSSEQVHVSTSSMEEVS